MAKDKQAKSAERVESNTEPSGFEAPAGYSKVKFGKVSGIKDKQVWLVQVPAGLDVSQLKSLPVDAKSKSFTVGGKSFALTEDTKASAASDNGALTKLLVGSSSGELSVSSKNISRVFKVVEKVALPDIKYDEVRTPKPVVEQKDNLHMRFTPTGYGPSDYVADEAHPSEQSALPKQNHEPGASQKSKTKGDKKKDKTESPSKSKDKTDSPSKSKKDKKRPSEDDSERKKKKHKKSKNKD